MVYVVVAAGDDHEAAAAERNVRNTRHNRFRSRFLRREVDGRGFAGGDVGRRREAAEHAASARACTTTVAVAFSSLIAFFAVSL